MLFIFSLLFFAAWIFGFIVFHVSGWLIHLLLVLAVISLLVRVIIGE